MMDEINLGTAYMGQFISVTDIAFWMSPAIPHQLRGYLIYGSFLNQ